MRQDIDDLEDRTGLIEESVGYIQQVQENTNGAKLQMSTDKLQMNYKYFVLFLNRNICNSFRDHKVPKPRLFFFYHRRNNL